MLELLIDFILGPCWVWVKRVMLLKTEREEKKQVKQLNIFLKLNGFCGTSGLKSSWFFTVGLVDTLSGSFM